MKKLTLSNINLILAIGGIVILLAAYMLGFKPYTEKNAELQNQITEKQTYLDQLNHYADNVETYEQGIESSKKNIVSMLSRLPVKYQTEDLVLYLKRFHDELNLELNAINFISPAEIARFSTIVDNQNKEVVGYQTGASYSLELNYKQMKNYMNAVYAPDNSVNYIDSINMVYNGSNAKLSLSINLLKYYIDYEDGVYTPEKEPSVVYGTPDPFGTTH